jgi:hypothetical protein
LAGLDETRSDETVVRRDDLLGNAEHVDDTQPIARSHLRSGSRLWTGLVHTNGR